MFNESRPEVPSRVFILKSSENDYYISYAIPTSKGNWTPMFSRSKFRLRGKSETLGFEV